MNHRSALITLGLLLTLGAGCSSRTGTSGPLPDTKQSLSRVVRPANGSPAGVLTHIIFIIQENRSTDNLFNGFCASTNHNSNTCAATVTVDPYTGKHLKVESMAAPFGAFHDHSVFVNQYDNGKMDGFSNWPALCESNPTPCLYSIMGYVPSSETQIYQQLATVDGELADENFSPASAPSVPNHLYMIAGESGGYDSDHWAIASGVGGNCGVTQKVETQLLMTTAFPGQNGNPSPPCKDFPTIFDLLHTAGKSWTYYSNDNAGFWSPTQMIQHLYNSPNFVVPSTQILTDISKGKLTDVAFVSPYSPSVSDHPGNTTDPKAGQTWVASIVNAIGQSAYWNNTAVIVTWDEWGGLYDHVKPPLTGHNPSWMGNPDPMEYSFRVPLVVASAYARLHRVDHQVRSFVSVLKLIEETFSLPSLGTLDQYEPGLDNMFDFTAKPRPYVPLGGSDAQPSIYLRSHHATGSLKNDD
ncbi:MAG: hypothetical protein JO060_06470 [Candidatus Eremiobacteraeota bacterium]|nr:hypothetical protein [Candidatus Eremiobacteraeota bacterium]MBV9647577.1 hypothetical protein [Candidatus Eremiobacteraeota bacterium]